MIVKKLPTIPVIDANFKHNAVLVAIMNEDETITCCEKKVRARAIKGSEDQAITSSAVVMKMTLLPVMIMWERWLMQNMSSDYHFQIHPQIHW